MQKGHLGVNVLGTSFELEADQKDEYLQSIYGYYLSVVEKAKESADVNDPLKVAIIAGLSDGKVAPDAFIAMEHTAMKMIAKIDDIINYGE